jgi:hypothetical protein
VCASSAAQKSREKILVSLYPLQQAKLTLSDAGKMESGGADAYSIKIVFLLSNVDLNSTRIEKRVGVPALVSEPYEVMPQMSTVVVSREWDQNLRRGTRIF